MRGIGIMIRRRGGARMNIWMEPSLWGIGRRIGNMDMVLRHGRIMLSMRGIMSMERNMGLALLNGQMHRRI